MNPARRKLIEELIRVGRLIDPATSSKNTTSEVDTKQNDISVSNTEKEFEDIPLMETVVNTPYTTKDMFIAGDEPKSPSYGNSDDSNIVDTISEPEHTSTKTVDDESVSRKDNTLAQSESPEEFPITELARELVVLIEEKVSKRSGEYLDDAFRDELTEAVTRQLESWLHYD